MLQDVGFEITHPTTSSSAVLVYLVCAAAVALVFFGRRFRAVVFCRECGKHVVDCAHFVAPLKIAAVEVFDPKVKTLAYDANVRVLEITFKNGQVWQLFGVKPDIDDELLHATISSFLKFLAPRFKAAPVRTGSPKHDVPKTEPCPACKRPMTEQHRTGGGILRILWNCVLCDQTLWRTYSGDTVREPRRG